MWGSCCCDFDFVGVLYGGVCKNSVVIIKNKKNNDNNNNNNNYTCLGRGPLQGPLFGG